jgi:hypothetical protein
LFEVDKERVGVVKVAALYVQTNGCYFGLENVEPWDIEKDARMYGGPYPVVAHPPCQRWGKFWKGQPGNINKGIIERKGDDKGCFKSALFDVRRYGGVIEHPEYSNAWKFFNINKPVRAGGWISAGDCGGWTCRVEQGRYGHVVAKPTWLYLHGLCADELPNLRWGIHEVTKRDFPEWAIRKHGLDYCYRAGPMAFHGGGKDSPVRIATPIEFRDLLVSTAMRCAKQ